MKNFILITSISFLLLGCGGESKNSSSLPVASEQKEPPKPPNVIVIFTDDHGYADLGSQNQVADIHTPNIDTLAANGVRFTNGYVTAPQCAPSRAGLLTGVYQQRFGFDENKHGPLPTQVQTIATAYKELGYATGMVGKWHLEVTNSSLEWAQANAPDLSPFRANDLPIDTRKEYFPDAMGFDYTVMGYQTWFWRNFDSKGLFPEAAYRKTDEYRIDHVTNAAADFIRLNNEKPFFLYISPYGPHVPLEAIEEDLSLFSDNMPTRRKYALAMLHAIDRGVGSIVSVLEEFQLLENTLIFIVSDNGAPLGETMEDAPLTEYGIWDGSLNTPLTGEKGMLTEGGIKVPFIAYWQGKLSGGLVVDTPVLTLDIAKTALGLAGMSKEKLEQYDGEELMGVMTQQAPINKINERAIYWRFYGQRAIRKGDWKYLQAGIEREYLFNLADDPEEKINLINDFENKAAELKSEYEAWDRDNKRIDPYSELGRPFARRFDYYLDRS